MKLYLCVVILLLAGCASNGSQTSFENESEGFARENNKACNLEHENNQAYCKCMSTILDELIPMEVKEKVMQGGYSSSMMLVSEMLRHRETLRKCDDIFVYDLAIIKTPDSDYLKNILNERDVLEPNEVYEFDYSDLEIGYEYTLQNVAQKDNKELGKGLVHRLTKIEGDDYMFSIVNDKGELEHENKFIWNNGYLYVVNKRSNKIEYLDRGSECKYRVGFCSYFTASGEKKEVYTEFIGGVWHRNEKGLGRKRRPVKEVYDKYGMPLYYYTKSLFENETVRVD